jgi:hypothetical protein
MSHTYYNNHYTSLDAVAKETLEAVADNVHIYTAVFQANKDHYVCFSLPSKNYLTRVNLFIASPTEEQPDRFETLYIMSREFESNSGLCNVVHGPQPLGTPITLFITTICSDGLLDSFATAPIQRQHQVELKILTQ